MHAGIYPTRDRTTHPAKTGIDLADNPATSNGTDVRNMTERGPNDEPENGRENANGRVRGNLPDVPRQRPDRHNRWRNRVLPDLPEVGIPQR